ncbi:hypothetical protein [Streptomyces stackebrandtii]
MLDYPAFLWAEAVIVCCLITVVITGFRAECDPTAATTQ